MFVFFSIFVCEKRKENTPICRAQSYKGIRTSASCGPYKIIDK